MPDDLLTSAREQAEKSEPDIRVAALLRIARVESAVNRERARKTFDRALSEARLITGVEGHILLGHARLIAAAVAPDLLPDIPDLDRQPGHMPSEMIGKIMLDHHHLGSAFDHVVRYDYPSSFPFSIAAVLIQSLDNDENRQAVLRSAIKAWRTARDTGHFHSFRFLSIFRSHWKLLPLEEAAEVAREIVRVALEQPDQPVNAKYGPDGSARITSGREHTLFQIFSVIRQVDAPLAESLIASHAQLAAALQRFPDGTGYFINQPEARRVESGRTVTGRGFGMIGSREDFPYMTALIQASQDGDFEPAMRHAIEKYREDSAPESPNRVPKEFWPSASRFRSILYKAGKQFGHAAVVHLEPIPDADLRLFAQIELAAALAGLPEFQGVQRQYRPAPGAPARGLPAHPDAAIRCPKCHWPPAAESRWSCRCGHRWNTFQTRGLCPGCGYQWTITACLNCGQTSRHSHWYAKEQSAG